MCNVYIHLSTKTSTGPASPVVLQVFMLELEERTRLEIRHAIVLNIQIDFAHLKTDIFLPAAPGLPQAYKPLLVIIHSQKVQKLKIFEHIAIIQSC